MIKYPHHAIEKLENLGHKLVKRHILANHYDMICENCGTIFTVTGGWDKDIAWYNNFRTYLNIYYLENNMWFDYPDMTCGEFATKDIIE